MISQIDLITAINAELDRQGVSAVNARQANAIIAAANDIIRELERQHKPATPGMGLEAWLRCDETGASSEYLAGVLSGKFHRPAAYPHDPADFGRCVKMLEAAPELNKKLYRLNKRGPHWRALWLHWDELTRLWRDESPSGTCPRLYARMQELLK